MSTPDYRAATAVVQISTEQENWEAGAIDTLEYANRLHGITTSLLFDLLGLSNDETEQEDGIATVH